jgi:preprotein translocase subunit SecB
MVAPRAISKATVTKEKPMSDEFAPIPGADNGNGGAEPEYRMQALGQYVKDLSFENPGAPMGPSGRPEIDLGVDLQARRLEQDRFEVELKLRVSAKAEEKAVFLLELVYGGLFMIQNMPDDVLQQVLLIDAPQLLFPFARRIVADVVRDGGMPPLMIEPIDFASLYRAKMADAEAQQSGTA